MKSKDFAKEEMIKWRETGKL